KGGHSGLLSPLAEHDCGYSGPLSPLAELARDALRLHRAALEEKVTSVLLKSMPILYFGNEVGYRASKRRILTVGLNPSYHEFPDADPFARFPNARPIKNEAAFY